MYMLMTYDVEAQRTENFKKLLRRYLIHEQFSVFSGDITEANAIKLRRQLSQLIIPGDRITEVTSANRQNVEVVHFFKASDKGEMKREVLKDHKVDFKTL
jgi:CRISPR-associated protein Cas2